MKKIFTAFTFIAVLSLFLISCGDDTITYTESLATENKAIAAYITRNNIEVITSAPINNEWSEKQFLKTSSGLYIHLVDTGEVGETVKSGELITYRFYKISLDISPDTVIRNWTSADFASPAEFYYQGDGAACEAFQEAVKIMKRHNSHAQLIVPSKIGFSEDYSSVTPYFYEYKLQLTNTY